MESERERAQEALRGLESAILDFVKRHRDGVRNDEISRELGLETSFNGGQRNYLVFSILARLVERGAVRREKQGNRVIYSYKTGAGHT